MTSASSNVKVLDVDTTPWGLSVDNSIRLYNVGVVALVSYDLAKNVWAVYKATDPVTFVGVKFAGMCVSKFRDHLFDIGVHSYRASITKDSSFLKKAIGVGLDIVRIADIIYNIDEVPYRSDIPIGINKIDILNHGLNLFGTYHNRMSAKIQQAKAKTD